MAVQPDMINDRMESLPLAGRRLVLDALVHGKAALPWEQAVLSIVRCTAAMLESQGASVLVTTGTPSVSSVASRAEQLEQHSAEVLVCLRIGSHPSTQIRGVRALVPGPYAFTSRRLAERLLKRIGDRTGLPSRGVPLWSWFPADLAALIRRHRPLSLVVECATPTCPADELLLMRRSFQVRVAHGLTEGLLEHFGLMDDRFEMEEVVPLDGDGILDCEDRPTAQGFPGGQLEPRMSIPAEASRLMDGRLQAGEQGHELQASGHAMPGVEEPAGDGGGLIAVEEETLLLEVVPDPTLQLADQSANVVISAEDLVVEEETSPPEEARSELMPPVQDQPRGGATPPDGFGSAVEATPPEFVPLPDTQAEFPAEAGDRLEGTNEDAADGVVPGAAEDEASAQGESQVSDDAPHPSMKQADVLDELAPSEPVDGGLLGHSVSEEYEVACQGAPHVEVVQTKPLIGGEFSADEVVKVNTNSYEEEGETGGPTVYPSGEVTVTQTAQHPATIEEASRDQQVPRPYLGIDSFLIHVPQTSIEKPSPRAERTEGGQATGPLAAKPVPGDKKDRSWAKPRRKTWPATMNRSVQSAPGALGDAGAMAPPGKSATTQVWQHPAQRTVPPEWQQPVPPSQEQPTWQLPSSVLSQPFLPIWQQPPQYSPFSLPPQPQSPPPHPPPEQPMQTAAQLAGQPPQPQRTTGGSRLSILAGPGQPEPMAIGPDGSWISQKAQALLRGSAQTSIPGLHQSNQESPDSGGGQRREESPPG